MQRHLHTELDKYMKVNEEDKISLTLFSLPGSNVKQKVEDKSEDLCCHEMKLYYETPYRVKSTFYTRKVVIAQCPPLTSEFRKE